MSVLNKIAAKIVDSSENPDKTPLDEMNFRQRAKYYTGQAVGQGIGKVLPDSVLQMLGDAIRAEKATREETRAAAAKQQEENKKKEERDRQLKGTVEGSNERLDQLIKINKKMLKALEEGGRGGGFGGVGAVGAAAASGGLMGLLRAAPMLSAGAGLVAAGNLASLFGVGDKNIDTKQDDKNWQRMTLWEKAQSSLGRGIENVGDWIMPPIANEARADRIKTETGILDSQDQTKIKQLLKQKLSPEQRKQYEDDMALMKGIEPNKTTPESSKALIRAMKAKREIASDDQRLSQLADLGYRGEDNHAFAFMGAPASTGVAAAPSTSGPVNSGTPNLSALPIPSGAGAVALGSNKSALIQAIEQQTSLRQQNAGDTQEIRLEAANIYIGSKTGGQVIKFESPSITYEADKIEFKLRNGQSGSGSSAVSPPVAGGMSGGAGGTPPAMMEALKQMGYNPGGSGGSAGGSDQQPYAPGDPQSTGPGGTVNRSAFDEEMKDPAVRARLMALAHVESGGQGPRAQQKFMETVFNRAAMNGHTLSDTMTQVGHGRLGYYPSMGNYDNLTEAQRKRYRDLMSKVHAGSDLSEGATDNASDEPGNPVASNALRRGNTGKWDNGELFYRKREQNSKWQKWRSSTYTAPDQTQQSDKTLEPGGKFSWGKVDKSQIHSDLASAAEAAAGYLPKGYSVQATSGHRPGDPRLHGRHLASDFQITGPNGEVIPNSGADSSGMYKQYAQHMYGWMQQNNPNAAGSLAWGGSFPIPYGRRYGQADLMHFDMGGQRGRWSQYQPQNMGGVRGVDYSQPPQSYARAPKPETDANERIRAASMLSRQQSTPATPPPSTPKSSDPMSEELGKIGYVGTQPSGAIDNSPSSDPGKVGIARDYFERLFGDSPSGWS